MSSNGYSLQPVGAHRKGDPQNRWRVKVSLGLDPVTGKYPQRSTTVKAASKRQAHAKAVVWADEATGASGTVSHHLDRWMAERATRNRPQTMAGYQSKVDRHIRPALGSRSMADLDGRVGKQTMASWQANLDPDLSDGSVNGCIRLMRAFVRWSERTGVLESTMCLNALEPRKGSEKVPAPDHADVMRLLDTTRAAEPDLWALLFIGATAGPRRSELAGLNVGDVTFEEIDGQLWGQLKIERALDRYGALLPPKSETSRRTIPLGPVAASVLMGHLERTLELERSFTGVDVRQLEPDRPLFPHPATWERHTVDQLSNRFNAAMRRAGLPKGWGGGRGALHGLRRSFATQARADDNTDALVVQGLMGHSSASMTDQYTTVLDASSRQTIAAVEQRFTTDVGSKP